MFSFVLSFIFAFFSFITLDSDNDKNLIKKLIKEEIIVEYKICGIWYKKSKTPSSLYILCRVLSLKNKAFTVYNKVKENKNKQILIMGEL